MEIALLTPPLLAEADARFHEALRDPDGAQRELLLRIVKRNAETEYGRAHQFASISSVADYRARVPIVDYEGLRALNERACGGEADLLVAGRAVYAAQTSGTTDGRPKLFGFSREAAADYAHYMAPALAAMERDHPGTIDHTLRLTSPATQRNSAGLLTGFASGFGTIVLKGLPTACPVPDEILGADFEARYYGFLRLGLQYSVRCIAVITAGTLLTLFRRAYEHGDALARDLEAGTISGGPTLDRDAVAAATPLLRADPAGAERLRRSLREHGRFMPRDIWPELRVIQSWKGGSSQHDLDAIAEACPGIPIRPQNSGATEAALLVPLADAWTGGVPALLSTFFEMFPAEQDPASATFVPISELEPRQGYRALVSNERGAYRYTIDDVFFIEDMYRGVPVLRYSHRLGVTSSMAGEKLMEVQVIAAAARTTEVTGLRLGDYQLVPERGTPSRYLLLAELPPDASGTELREFLQAFETELRAQNPTYHLYRNLHTLDAPLLAQLPAGEFERRRRRLADATRRSDAQIKTLRLATDEIKRAEVQVLRWVTMTEDV